MEHHRGNGKKSKNHKGGVMKTSRPPPPKVEPQNFRESMSSDEDYSDDHSVAPGFDEVMNTFCNVGSHFMFKYEKQANENDPKAQSGFKSSLFYIDSQLLSNALVTIPFYERVELDPCLFTALELENQDRIANEREENYRKFCEGKGSRKAMPAKSPQKCSLPMIQQQTHQQQQNKRDSYGTYERDELDQVFERTKSFSVVDVVGVNPDHNLIECRDHTNPPEREDKEHMQKWLDTLLL